MKHFTKTVKALNNTRFNVEMYDSANEVVRVSKQRKVTSSSFHNFDAGYMPSGNWAGVKTFQDALDLMRDGYQPTVDEMKAGIKANVRGQQKRISFYNDMVGFQPIVPLALQGVPNCMVNSHMMPIKTKVIDVYYDMTCSSDTSSESIVRAGQKLLAAIMELEMQGYRFNLYATQNYYGGSSADMLCTKVKSSNTQIDLKRISFPLTHTAYFRVIGFDWYSKVPGGKYRNNYGHSIAYDFAEERLNAGFKELFGGNCIVFSAAKILRKDTEHIKTVLTSGKDEK